jgi:polyisoprenoid-binding protein YceI
MKKITLLAASVIALSSFKPAPTVWTYDAAHSKLRFSITHMMVSDVEGSFKIKEVTLTAPNANDFADASVTMTADAASVNTDNDARDAHLRKPDFFDTEKYPTLSFQSTSFKKLDAHKYKVAGNLTMHGVTKPVSLEVVALSGTNPMNNKPIAGFKVTGKVKRTDFNIAPSTPSSVLSDEVELTANMEFGQK